MSPRFATSQLALLVSLLATALGCGPESNPPLPQHSSISIKNVGPGKGTIRIRPPDVGQPDLKAPCTTFPCVFEDVSGDSQVLVEPDEASALLAWIGCTNPKNDPNLLCSATVNNSFPAKSYEIFLSGCDKGQACPELLHRTTNSTQKPLNAVWGVSDVGQPWLKHDEAWAVGVVAADGGKDAILHWNGHQWVSEGDDCIKSELFGIWGTSASDIWAVGDNATFVHRDANGWKCPMDYSGGIPTNKGSLSSSTGLRSIWGTKQSVWVVGANGVILRHSIENGAINGPWFQITLPAGTEPLLQAIWGDTSSPSRLSAAGSGCRIYSWKANDDTAQMSSPLCDETKESVVFYDISGVGSTGWAVGSKPGSVPGPPGFIAALDLFGDWKKCNLPICENASLVTLRSVWTESVSGASGGTRPWFGGSLPNMTGAFGNISNPPPSNISIPSSKMINGIWASGAPPKKIWLVGEDSDGKGAIWRYVPPNP